MRKFKLLPFIFLLTPITSFCAGPADSFSYPSNCVQIVGIDQKVSQEYLSSCIRDIVEGINETRGQSSRQIAEKGGELSQLIGVCSEQNKDKDSKIEQLENRIKSLENALDNLKKEIRPSKPKTNKK